MAVSSSVDRFNGVIASKAIKVRCVVAAIADIPATGGAPSGITNPINGVFVQNGDRVLLTAQSPASENGIWVANANGPWTRAADWDGNRDVELGTVVFVGASGGADDELWQLTAPAGEIVVGSTNVTIEQLVFGAGSFDLQDVTTNGETTDVGITIIDGGDLIIRESQGRQIRFSMTSNPAVINLEQNTGPTVPAGINFTGAGSEYFFSTFVRIVDGLTVQGNGYIQALNGLGTENVRLQHDDTWGRVETVGTTPILIASASGGFYVPEISAAGASTAAFGQIWVRDDAPNTLMFTDDAGTDFVIGGAALSLLPSGNVGEMAYISGAPDTYSATARFQVIGDLPELHENADTTNTKRLGVGFVGVEIFGSEDFDGDPSAGEDQDVSIDLYNNSATLVASIWYDEGPDLRMENLVEGGRIDFMTTQSPGGGGIDMLSLSPAAGGRGIRFDTHSLGGRVNIPDNDPVINLATSVNVAKYQIVDTINAGNVFGHFGYDGSTLELEIKNLVASSSITLKGTDSGLVERTFFNANPNSTTVVRADTDLLLQASAGAQAWTFTSGGVISKANVTIDADVIDLRNSSAQTMLRMDQTGPTSSIRIEAQGPIAMVNGITNRPVIYFQEIAAAVDDFAGFGQFWVRNDVPNTPMFTDDAGNDYVLNQLGVGAGSVTDAVLRYDGADWVEATGLQVQAAAPSGAFEVTTTQNVSEQNLRLRSGASFLINTDDNAATALTIDGPAASGGASAMTFTGTLNLQTGGGITRYQIDNDNLRHVFNDFPIFIEERASAGADVAGYGQLWVRNDAPNNLMFTGDTGVDSRVALLDAVNQTFSPDDGNNRTLGLTTGPWVGAADNHVSLRTATNDDNIEWHLEVADGVNNRRARFFLSDENGEFGLQGSASSGVPELVMYVGTNEAMRIASTGDALFGDNSLNADSRVGAIENTGGIEMRVTSAGAGQINQLNSAGVVEDVWIAMARNGGVSLRYNNVAQVSTGALGTQFDLPLYIFERTNANTDSGGFGQLWVRDDTPNTLMFTDDAGNDIVVAQSGGVGTVNNPMTEDLDGANFNLDSIGALFLNQRASADTDITDDGQIWVEDTNPQRAAFTNDDGDDVYIHPLTVRKTADENVNNSTAFQDDDHLTIDNLPAGQYRIDMLLTPRDVAVTGCGMRLTFSASGVASQSMMHVLGDTFSGAAAPAYDEVGRITDTFDAIPLDTGSGTSRVMVTGYFRSFGSGSIQFRWAQNTAQVGDLRLEANSWLTVTQLGQA